MVSIASNHAYPGIPLKKPALVTAGLAATLGIAAVTLPREADHTVSELAIPETVEVTPWTTHQSPMGSYSIDFPGETQTTQQSDDQTVSELTTLRGSDGTYVSMVSIFPMTFKEADAKELLAATADGLVLGSNADLKLESREEITIDGHPGIGIRAVGPTSHAVLHARLYVVGNQVHQNLFTGERGKTRGFEIERFLNSFRFR